MKSNPKLILLALIIILIVIMSLFGFINRNTSKNNSIQTAISGIYLVMIAKPLNGSLNVIYQGELILKDNTYTLKTVNQLDTIEPGNFFIDNPQGTYEIEYATSNISTAAPEQLSDQQVVATATFTSSNHKMQYSIKNNKQKESFILAQEETNKYILSISKSWH